MGELLNINFIDKISYINLKINSYKSIKNELNNNNKYNKLSYSSNSIIIK